MSDDYARVLTVVGLAFNLVGVAALTLTPTQAVAFTGSDLYQFCIEKKDKAQNTACVVYVRGFIDGMVDGDLRRFLGDKDLHSG